MNIQYRRPKKPNSGIAVIGIELQPTLEPREFKIIWTEELRIGAEIIAINAKEKRIFSLALIVYRIIMHNRFSLWALVANAYLICGFAKQKHQVEVDVRIRRSSN